MAANELISILESTATGCKYSLRNQSHSLSLSLAQNGLRAASEYLAKAANDNLVRSPAVAFENAEDNDLVFPRENF